VTLKENEMRTDILPGINIFAMLWKESILKRFYDVQASDISSDSVIQMTIKRWAKT